MKKILYVAMSALMLTSCYEDKGNYDYHSMISTRSISVM